jgi:serine/threonine-protein kinase
VSGAGGKGDDDDASASSSAPDFLKDLAASPERTLPSPEAGARDEPTKLGHFTVLDRLGEGGMGVVYRARDEKLGRIVALKLLPPGFEADDARRQRFLREARVAAAVTHPNLTTVYEVGESGGRVFIAMEMVEGKALRAVLDGHPLPAGTVLDLALQITAGIGRAHAAGIVHRDLKPENIMVSEDGHVKVLDFGLAKRPAGDEMLLTGTGEGMLLGTPAYMPPEQARGQSVTAATDVFALGVLFYEMLTGQRPFTGKNLPQLIRSIEQDTPAAPSSLNPLVPAAFDAIVDRCLRKAPAQRYADAQVLLEELRKVEAAASRVSMASTVQQPITDSLVTPAPSTAPRRPRPWRRGVVLGVSLAALGAAVVVAIFGARRFPPPSLPAASPSAPPSVPTTLADLPLPTSAVHEAVTEYAAGIQLLRDDSWRNAVNHFKRAIELDPTMGLAHLRAAEAGSSTMDHEFVRLEMTKAGALRSQFSERDRALLDALEPLLERAEPDESECLRRLEVAGGRYPMDEEFIMLLSQQQMSDPARAAATARRGLELDPRNAQDLETLGRSLALGGDVEGGRRALELCGTISPESSDCVNWLATLDGQLGRCDDVERESRRVADVDLLVGNVVMANALAALDRPEAVVRDVLARGRGAKPDPAFAAWYDAAFAIAHGRFDLARAALGAAKRAVAGMDELRSDLAANEDLAAQLADLLLETGEDSGAGAVAQESLDRRETMTRVSSVAGASESWWFLAVAGHHRDPRSAVWRDEALQEGTPGAIVWASSWARPARTPAEAGEAFEALAKDPRLSLPRGTESLWRSGGDTDGCTGHAELLAGRPADALPFLRRAANNCFVLAEPFVHVHARLDLGRALEQTGDTPGACTEYGRVVTQWGNAKPRSVSAEAARDAVKRLHCGAPKSPLTR